MSERFFEPKRLNKDAQDAQYGYGGSAVNGQPAHEWSLAGASANPGSAVGYKVAGSGTGYAYEQTGFVGTKQPPEDTSPAQPTVSLAVLNNNTPEVTVTATLSSGNEIVRFRAVAVSNEQVVETYAATNAQGQASVTISSVIGEVRVWASTPASRGVKTTINVT
jgi:hypothetical protein